MTTSSPARMNPQVALQRALMAQDTDAVRVAVAQGANLNATLPNGQFPLLSVFHRLPSDTDEGVYLRRGYDLLRVLFDLGARADRHSPHGGSVFHKFVRQELLSFDAESERVHGPVPQEDSLEAVRLWLDHGAPVLLGSPQSCTPLDAAEDLSYEESVNEDFYLKPGWGEYVRSLLLLWVEYGYPKDQVLAFHDKDAPTNPVHHRFGHLMVDMMHDQLGPMESSESHSLAYQNEMERRAVVKIQIMQDLVDEGQRLHNLRERQREAPLDGLAFMPSVRTLPDPPVSSSEEEALRWQDLQARDQADPLLAQPPVQPTGPVSSQQALADALVAQDAEAIRQAVARGADPNAPLPNGQLPLLSVFHPLPEEWGHRTWARNNEEKQAYRRRGYDLQKTLFDLGARADTEAVPGYSAFFLFAQDELAGFTGDPSHTSSSEYSPLESLAALRCWLEHGASPLACGVEEDEGKVSKTNVLDYAEWLSYLEANRDVTFTSSHLSYVRDLALLLMEYGFSSLLLQDTVPTSGPTPVLRYSHLAANFYEATPEAKAQRDLNDTLDWGTPAYVSAQALRDVRERHALKGLAEEGDRLHTVRTASMTDTPTPRRRRLR